jgi:O-acetyl-ADP-ribose deacetylase
MRAMVPQIWNDPYLGQKKGACPRQEEDPAAQSLTLAKVERTHAITVAGTTIEVRVGDLLEAGTDAITNAANSQLWMGGGVAGSIKAAAGEEVEREAMAQGPIEPGQAVATAAGRLPPPTRWVIHAATMGPDLKTSEDYIRRATASALAKAVEVGAMSIALPALGTGVGGFPIERAARLMVSVTRDAASSGQAPARVVFVVRGEAAATAFANALV